MVNSSYTPLLATINKDVTKKSTSSSAAYFGFDKDTKAGNNNEAIFVFDGDKLPKYENLKYKKDIAISISLSGDVYKSEKESGTFKIDSSEEDFITTFNCYVSNKNASDLVSNNHSYFLNNTAKTVTPSKLSSLGEIEYYYDTATEDLKMFDKKSFAVKFTKKKTDSNWYGGKFNKSYCYMHINATDIVPIISFNSVVGDNYRTQPYTIRLNYVCNYKNINVPLKNWSISWKSVTGKTGTVQNLTNIYYTFPANTFPVNELITFTVTATSADGVSKSVFNTKEIRFLNPIPNATMTYPVDGIVVYKSNQIKFEWSYSDDSGSPQTAYKIRWNGGEVTEQSANKYHIFDINTFPVGVVTYYLQVTNGYGQSKEIGPFTFNASLSTPSVEGTTPINEDIVYMSQKNTFKWNYSDPAGLKQTKAVIHWNCGIKNGTLTVNGRDTYKIVNEYIFPEGILEWNVTVTNEDGNTTTSDTYKATVKASTPTVVGTYPTDGILINYSQNSTVTWAVKEDVITGIVRWTLNLRNDSVEKNYSGTTETSCVITPSEFGEGRVDYTISVTNRDGKTGVFNSHFEIVKATPVITPIYPIGISVVNSVDNTFLWNYTDKPILVGQKSFALKITNQNTGEPKIFSGGSEQYCTIPAGTLENGNYSWVVRVTNNDDVVETSREISFIAVGPSKKPVIYSVSQNAKPIITWSVEDAVAYELSIEDANGIKVYEEELNYLLPFINAEGKYKSTVTQFLENGSYTITIRTLNSYGYYTEWTRYAFNLKAYNTLEPGEIFIENNKQFGVSIDNLVANNQAEYNYISEEEYMLGGYGLRNAGIMIFSESETEAVNAQVVWAVFEPYVPGTNPEKGKMIPLDPTFDTTGLYDITRNEDLVRNIKVNGKEPQQFEDDAEFICNINYSNISFPEKGIQLLEKETLFNKATGKAYEVTKYLPTARIKLEYEIFENGLWFGKLEQIKPPGDFFWQNIKGNNEYFVCRQDKDVVKTLGKYKKNECDYSVAFNKEYKYNMLVYNQGIKYTNSRKVIVEADGVVIRDLHDDSNFVHIWKTESKNMDILKQKDRTKSLYNVLGRKNPIKETGEWITNTRSFNAYVTEEEFERLERMIENSEAVRYQADQEYMICDMELQNTGIYENGGRFISVSLTQIEED